MAKKNIGLDDLFSNNKTTQPVDTGGITDLVVTQKSKKENRQIKEINPNSIYEKYAVKLYMVDCSGSMNDPCVEDTDVELDWPEDLKAYLHRVLSYTYGRSEEVLAFKDVIEETSVPDLKKAIINMGPDEFDIRPKRDPTKTKMTLVKKSIADLVDRRYEKDPDARVALGSFEMDAHIEASDHDGIKIKLNNFHPGGGTSIMQALNESLRYFEKYPSPVNVHQLIIISDAEDWNSMEAPSLLPRMKELGVTLDFIYIKNKGAITETASSVAKMFTELCKETGGDYVEVDSPSQFEKKLIIAADRLCLPPGV